MEEIDESETYISHCPRKLTSAEKTVPSKQIKLFAYSRKEAQEGPEIMISINQLLCFRTGAGVPETREIGQNTGESEESPRAISARITA